MVRYERLGHVLMNFHQSTMTRAAELAQQTGRSVDECVDDVIGQTSASASAAMDMLRVMDDASPTLTLPLAE